uniref:Uncharacterized protein n=2 Tax=Emiliania huxleyi TaxID=2903 RepID=A0A6V2M3A0_EMIHU|mmetsp:Transcript_29984/g.89140  ORF Transcript_29984/g.89140 Transcript_29984/m.89140 type:complete len:263 (-) Transcript_29984:615-1403(-)
MFWNEFDALDVAIRASNASAVPSDVEGVLAEAGGLAAWVEARKFGASIEGGACGSALLREVAAAAVDVGGPDLHVFSAHYPTMLCALTAVGVSVSSGESADSWLGEALLPTGSALAFEVVPPEAAGAAAASAAVRLLYWDGSEWRLIPVPCSRSEARLASCPLDAFVRHVEVSLPDGAAWCRACDNDSLARCRLAAFEAITTQECAADAAASAAVAVICLLSILLFGACLVIGWLIRSAKAPRQGRAVVSRMTFPGSGLQAA